MTQPISEINQEIKSEQAGLDTSAGASPEKDGLSRIDLLKKEAGALNNNNWKLYLSARIEDSKEMLNRLDSGYYDSSIDPDEIRADIKKDSYLLSHNIAPAFEDFSTQGFLFLKNMFIYFMPLFMVILLFLLTGDIVSKEREDGTYKLLLTQPVSRGKILASKYIASVLYSLMAIVGVLGGFFLILGLARGFGAAGYPVTVNGNFMSNFFDGKKTVFTVIPLYKFLALVSAMLILWVLTVSSFSLLSSTLFKSSVSSVTFLVMLTVALYVFTYQLKYLRAASPFIFFTYMNIPGLIDGSSAAVLGADSVTYANGIIVFSAYTIVCLISSSVIFKRRNFSD